MYFSQSSSFGFVIIKAIKTLKIETQEEPPEENLSSLYSEVTLLVFFVHLSGAVCVCVCVEQERLLCISCSVLTCCDCNASTTILSSNSLMTRLCH